MKRFMITEEQLQTLREETMRWMPHHVAIDALDMLRGLPENISVTLEAEAQPEAASTTDGLELVYYENSEDGGAGYGIAYATHYMAGIPYVCLTDGGDIPESWVKHRKRVGEIFALPTAPEAPNDWSGNSHHGVCHHCEHFDLNSKQPPCCECMHILGAWGEYDHWQPRTP